MKNSLFALLIFISFAISGCDKPNANPELEDPIYADLQKEYGIAKAAVASAKAAVAEHQKSINEAIPQTGQIKYAQKRFFEAEAALVKAEQMALYYEMRIESRLKWTKSAYLKAYNEKKPWPDPAEFEEYKAQKALEQASKSWSAKARIEESQAELKKSQTPAGIPAQH